MWLNMKYDICAILPTQLLEYSKIASHSISFLNNCIRGISKQEESHITLEDTARVESSNLLKKRKKNLLCTRLC